MKIFGLFDRRMAEATARLERKRYEAKLRDRMHQQKHPDWDGREHNRRRYSYNDEQTPESGIGILNTPPTNFHSDQPAFNGVSPFPDLNGSFSTPTF